MKKLIIEQPWSLRRNEFGEEIDWEGPEVVLRSYNRRVSPGPESLGPLPNSRGSPPFAPPRGRPSGGIGDAARRDSEEKPPAG